MFYRHTQRGTVIHLALLATAAIAVGAFVAWIPSGTAFAWGMLIPPLAMAAVLGAVAWYFSSMTIEVTDKELRWAVGPGRPHTVNRSEMDGVSIVRHPLWHGYGIRWLGPKRWTYIVSGRDTVEVRLKSGGWLRLGTDDPQGLAAALGATRHA